MPNNPGWIDFKELRMKLRMADVLKQFDVRLNIKGDRATGFCPLPTHQGQRNSPSFSASLERGIWQCFGCQAKGNVLDLASRLMGFNPDDPKALRQAAITIKDIFQIDNIAQPANAVVPAAKSLKKVLVNAPIDFELKTLDPEHPYLKERGFTAETIRHFGLGYCNRGLLRGRIAIPLHDPQGRLVGYAGRLTKDAEISEANPKYRFPGTREKDGITLEFHKSLLLYTDQRIERPVDHLFVVEGFPAAWWLWQAAYRNTVALMGSHCSEEQATLITDLAKPDGKIWIIPDGNEAGVRCAMSVLEQVSPHRFCRWIQLNENEQPTDYSADELMTLFS